MVPIEIGKHCKISFIVEVPCIHIQWFGLPPSEEFRKGCDTVIELMKEKKVSKILTDNSQASLFSVKDQQWLNDSWLPRAEKVGYKCSATVLGDTDAFVKFAAQSIAQKRDQSKFLSKFFKTKQEAITWLKTL
jgi:hypothetical protein